MNEEGIDANLVINDLSNQLANKSKELAFANALIEQYEKQLDELLDKSNKLLDANKEKENAKR